MFLEYSKNTQVIMYTLLTCQWYQLHLTRFCILLPCLFTSYKNSICFIGFHVLHVNKNLPKHIPNFLRRGVGIKIGIQFLSFIKSLYICTSSIVNFLFFLCTFFYICKSFIIFLNFLFCAANKFLYLEYLRITNLISYNIWSKQIIKL